MQEVGGSNPLVPTRYNKTLPLRRGFVVFGFGKQDLNLRGGGSTTSESDTGVSRSAKLMSARATQANAQSNPLVPTRYNKTLPLRRGFVVIGFGKQDLNLREGGSTTSESDTGVSWSAKLMSARATQANAQSNPLKFLSNSLIFFLRLRQVFYIF